jgi:adenylate cyclase
LPDKPSIAVLAFTNMGGDPEQEYFSDGISDEIITELSRSRELFVIARNSSFTYKGRPVDLRQVGRELGVHYVLEGSVRRSGGRVRLLAQLVDAITGNQIWADRYDRDLMDVFAVQDEITIAVVTAIQPAISDAELRRILRKPPENLGAWEAYQRGLWHIGKANPSDNEQAKQFFQRAITLDPTSPAHAAMAVAYVYEGAAYATLPLEEAIKFATGWARRAVEIDAGDADAQATLAFAALGMGNVEESWDRASLSVAIKPNSHWANCIMGIVLNLNGRPSQGRDAVVTALRLSPRDPNNALPLYHIAMSYYFEGDYANALEAARRVVSLYPLYPLSYRWLLASLGQLGRADEARGALRTAIQVSFESFDLYVRKRPPWMRPKDHEHMLDGLRKAGWPG